MKTRILMALGAVLAATPLAARAQVSTTSPIATQRELAAERRELAAERREALRARREARQAMTAEQRDAARARRAARIAAMPQDQQQYLRDMRSYQESLRQKSRELQGEVKANIISRDAMAQQLVAFRDANAPTRPAGMPERKRTP